MRLVVVVVLVGFYVFDFFGRRLLLGLLMWVLEVVVFRGDGGWMKQRTMFSSGVV